MSGQERPYVRVYYTIADDDRFLLVFPDSRILGDWLKLLLGADAAYPASAALPAGIRKASLDVLTCAECGLVEVLPNGRYVVHGLKAEREARSDQARENVGKRWNRDYGTPVVPSNYGGNTTAFDPVILAEPSLAEPSLAEPNQAEPSQTGAEAYYSVTLRYPQRGSALHDWTDRLGQDYGVEAFTEALANEHRRDRTLKTLLSRTEAALARNADRQAMERDAERRSAPPKLRPVETPEFQETRKRLANGEVL